MSRKPTNSDRSAAQSVGGRCALWERLHRSEQGLLSFSTSIAMLSFALLATLVLNVGQSVRQKIAVQNSADAAAQSAAVCMARGLNAVTAANHLLGELTALCVMHEALGGPELDAGTSLPSAKSLELNQKLITILPAATAAVAPYATLGTLDAPAVTLLVKDLGIHKSWATIYDSRLTLKYHLSLALSLRPVATALNIIPGAGPTLALSLHIAIAAVVSKIYIETQLLDLIDIVAQGFSPAKLAVESSVLPLLAGYAEQAVEQTPRAAARIVRQIGEENDVTTFLFPAEPKLPLVRSELKGGGFGGSEPPAGNASGGPADAAFQALQKVRQVVQDFVDFVKDAVSFNPLLSAIADEVLDIQVPSLSSGDGPGDDGFDDNLSRKKLPRLSTAGWDEIRYSQWMRATYPYVRAWRVPVRESLAGLQTLSFASKWYSRWTNRYALVKIRKYHQGEYGGSSGRKELAMFVMTDSGNERKGRENWTTDGTAAERLFTLVAFAHRKPPAPIGAAIFGSGPTDGLTTYAQSIYYNGNDQRPDGWSKSSTFQPTVGWDTLNWQSPATAGRAYEFLAGDDSGGVSLIPPRFPFIFLHDPPGDDPIVALNWQAKLTPVTRLDESWSQTPGDMRAPLQKMHANHGTFRKH
ncbi:MAG: hypothetical protein K8U03_02545 [Planctomycetia bacterium]|nr:hypothetical protein [Planctomycetia bacterium]